MASGGKRAGSGRKKKPVFERMLEGKEVEVASFDNLDIPDEIPEPRAFLTANQRQGEFLALEIRKEVWSWLKFHNCLYLISMPDIDEYATHYARFMQCQNMLSEYGLLGKHPTTEKPSVSQFQQVSREESKAARELMKEFRDIVRQTSLQKYTPPPNDEMAKLLAMEGNSL